MKTVTIVTCVHEIEGLYFWVQEDLTEIGLFTTFVIVKTRVVFFLIPVAVCL